MTTIGPALTEVKANYEKLKSKLVLTPVVDLNTMGSVRHQLDGARVHLKLECFQHTGTFKARGALTTVANTAHEVLQSGIVAVSAGNHGAATAFAASQQGYRSLVFMMQPANPFRVALCKSFGADVTVVPAGAHPFKEAQKHIETHGGFLMHPFEGPLIALGTGSLALEFLEQVPVFRYWLLRSEEGGWPGDFQLWPSRLILS